MSCNCGILKVKNRWVEKPIVKSFQKNELWCKDYIASRLLSNESSSYVVTGYECRASLDMDNFRPSVSPLGATHSPATGITCETFLLCTVFLILNFIACLFWLRLVCEFITFKEQVSAVIHLLSHLLYFVKPHLASSIPVLIICVFWNFYCF